MSVFCSVLWCVLGVLLGFLVLIWRPVICCCPVFEVFLCLDPCTFDCVLGSCRFVFSGWGFLGSRFCDLFGLVVGVC